MSQCWKICDFFFIAFFFSVDRYLKVFKIRELLNFLFVFSEKNKQGNTYLKEIQNNKFLKILNLSRWVYGKTWVELVHVLTTAVSLMKQTTENIQVKPELSIKSSVFISLVDIWTRIGPQSSPCSSWEVTKRARWTWWTTNLETPM